MVFVCLLQLLSLFQLFVSFAVDAEATFTSTERIRFYIRVSALFSLKLFSVELRLNRYYLHCARRQDKLLNDRD